MLSKGDVILDDSFIQYWNSADFRIANLECPITNSAQKVTKVGPNFKVSPAIVEGLKKMNIDAFSLANNHIMDYGKEGLLETCSVLESAGLKYFGVQKGSEEFSHLLIEKDSVTVAVLGYTCAEFSLADDFENFGAYPVNIFQIVEKIEILKKKADHIIVLLHCGLYNFAIPTPKLRELCQFLVKRGVSAVLCQHSHVCGATENYGDGFISYGQGSFVFDINRKNSTWNEGYMVSLKLDKLTMHASFRGTIQFDSDLGVGLMNVKQQLDLQRRLQTYENIIQDESLYKEHYKETIKKMRHEYYGLMLTSNNMMRRLARYIDVGRLLPNSMKRMYLNLYRNEEHREIIEAILKNDLK